MLKVGSFVSIALGPLLSQAVPMASDLRNWAFWFSAIVAAATFLWLSVRFMDETRRSTAFRDFAVCCAAAVIFAFAHIAINLSRVTEQGDFTDVLGQLRVIGTFGLAAGSVTGALVALDKGRR